MKTRVITENITEAAELIRQGALVAVPTETVYGLAGSGFNESAVERIYEVKGRPEVKPLSLMVPGPEAFEKCCTEVPQAARVLAERFWPGPLTIVLPAREEIPSVVLAGGHTVGLRCPDHPLTLRLLRECALPLAAPSANPSGEPSPKTAQQVLGYFDGKIEAVIDGGECGLGRESTIIDLTRAPYRILRRGALPERDIAAALGEHMRIIGLTGGTGTGKTTALEVLRGMGALCLDCDEVYHELTETSAELREALERRFGSVYGADGKLDRKKLGAVVFSDAAALSELNAITHGFVDEEIKRRLRDFAMTGGTLAAIDAVALFESGADGLCTETFGVIAPRELREARIMAREGISRDYARLRIDAQQPDEYYIERCTGILENSGTKAEFAAKCTAAFTEVIENGRKEGLPQGTLL